LSPRDLPLLRIESSGDFADLRDVLSNRLLFDADLIQAAVDARG